MPPLLPVTPRRRLAFAAFIAIAFTVFTTGSKLSAQEPLPLISPTDATAGWKFNHGQEFPGATGGLTVDAEAKHEGRATLKLAGDFTRGGLYVEMGRKIDRVEIRELTMWLRNPDSDRFTLRLNDASGQTHQLAIKTEPGAGWQRVVLPLERFFARRGAADAVTNIAKYESWGGAKDGKWHDPATAIYILASKPDGKTARTLWLNDLAMTPRAVAGLQPPAFAADFESGTQLGPEWSLAGDVKLASTSASTGSGSLLLARTLETVERPCSATSPAFAVTPGPWEISLASRAEFHSPDNSYNAVVQLEALDSAGKVVERSTVAEIFGKRAWQPSKQRVDLPKGAITARFHAQLNKTYGSFWLDDLSAACLAPALPKDDRIARVLFSTAQLGNLLFPNDPRRVSVEVLTRKPLLDNQRTITCVVRDYWGAEQTQPLEGALADAEKKGDGFSYAATLDLTDAPLEIGRYYEVHAAIAQPGDEPFRAYTSLAILPEAETKRFKPEEIPFTSRNWDNRITEYIKLSDRLGVRICGLWGGWSSKPPYQAEAPGLDLAQKLGMGWLTTTPCKFIEAGKRDYDEPALRQGVRHLIEQFGKVRPMIINLGNEPHGTGERVRANVAAYRAVYEEAKKVDPTIPVVATSVEPNEEYFKIGYGQWCDAFDFHIYESAEDVRRTIGEYHALMKKYDCVKPIWSTELGLNSQGQTRHAVAVELIKKFTTFFAAGGANASWFGLLYPDPDGKDHGSSGNSHNIFDCRFNRYAPRLDAVAYYNGVNAIAAKKFVDEKQYPDGIRAFLFRDREGRSLQVLWKDKGRQDNAVPLTGVGTVQVIRIDGSRRALNAGGKELTLTITTDPLLLLYQGGEKALPSKLEVAATHLFTDSESLRRGESMRLGVGLHGAEAKEVALEAPPFWKVEKSRPQNERGNVYFTITPPATSAVREVDLVVTLGAGGELYWRAPFPAE